MNWYWTIAGILMVLGGLAHTFIGEKKVIGHLKKNMPVTGFEPDVAFNLIRWFWYLGSYISFFVAGVALVIGMTDGVMSAGLGEECEPLIAKLMSGIIFGFVITFIIIALLNPKKLHELSQVIILLLVAILLWIG